MSVLFTPYALRDLSLRNRIVVSPMCQYSADEGRATDWHMMHLGQLALSGAGLLFIEATAVEPQGRITPADLGLWSDTTEQALARVVEAIRQYAAVPVAIQLSHAGRKASSQAPWDGGQLIAVADGGWHPSAPSAIAHKESEEAPLALDQAGLNRIREAFVAAARRAVRIGIQAIEVHAAHGYLLHQFLSPLANQRSDNYGGSLENRLRFPLEVFDAVRAAVPPEIPVGVRVSATDWVDGGWDLAQTVQFGLALKQRGCDWLDVSSGGVSPLQKIALGPGYQVPFAQTVKAEIGLPTIAVGMITEAQQAEHIVATGQADMIALARGILYDPRWPWHAAAELGAQVVAAKQYWRSNPHQYKNLFGDTRIGQR